MSTVVVFSCDDNYSAGVYINILAIEKNNKYFADKYVVYESSWSDDHINKVKSISDKVEVVKFNKEIFYKENMDIENLKLSSFINKWGYFKLGFSIYLTHLDNFDRVVFLDADVLVLSDISYLNTIESIGWRTGLLTYDYDKKKLQRPNAGVLVFHKSIPYKIMIEKYFDYILKYNSDELALLILAYDLKINIVNLGFEYNYVHVGRNLFTTNDEIKIYHCVGSDKIWNSEFLMALFPEFMQYLKCFEKIENQSNDIFKTRTDFIRHMLDFYFYKKFISSIIIYNKYIHVDFKLLYSNILVWYYKDYNSIKFRMRNLKFYTIRLYFDINSNKKFLEYVKIKSNLLYNNKYTYHKYSDEKSTFYIDCEVKKVESIFNEMISDFTGIIDAYDKELMQCFAGGILCNTLS